LHGRQGHLELQLNAASDAVVHVDAWDLQPALALGFVAQNGDVDLPVTGAGCVGIIGYERRTALSVRMSWVKCRRDRGDEDAAEQPSHHQNGRKIDAIAKS
jgi:hypothetical protein